MPPVAAATSLSAQADQLRKVNDQLRREVKLNRHKLGECAHDIISYCEKGQRTDPLIIKVPASDNPFRERRTGCALI